MNKTILILTNSITGLYSFRKEVVKAIAESGYTVYISLPKKEKKDERSKYFEDLGCKIIKTNFSRRGTNPIADFKLLLKYIKLIRQLRPKALLTYTIKPNIYGGLAAKICRIPQLSNITGLGDGLENSGWLQKLTIGLYRFALSKSHITYFQNKMNRDFCISKGIGGKHSVVLPGSGVNLQYHTMQPYPEEGEKIRFLYIGRILKDKGIEEYFEAAVRIKKRYPNSEFKILVLGKVDGIYKERLSQLEEEGIIHHHNSTIDVRPFIGAVECTIMPSYHEGMSNVNLESAANGRPVITTNVPGCQETVDDGKTGFLVEAKSADSLTSAIERFIALPYSQKVQMGQEGRKKVEREFDRQIVIRAYLDGIASL